MWLNTVIGIYQPLLIPAGLLLTILFSLYKYVTKDFDHWKKRGIPYIKPIPFVGNLKDVVTLNKSMGHALAEMCLQARGSLIGIWCFNKPHLIIRSPELISQILCKEFNHFHDRASGADKTVDPIAASMLFTLKYTEWKPIRHQMSPIFSSAKIKAMMPLLNEIVKEMLGFLDGIPDGIIEAKELFTKYTTEGIASCIFGVQANSFADDNAPFNNMGRKMFHSDVMHAIRGVTYFLWPKMASALKIKFIPPVVSNFLSNSFWQVLKERKKSGMKRNDMIDILIRLEDDIDDVTLVSQPITFFLAGFETTSSTMAFALYELCLNKKIQDALRAEIDTILSKYGGFTYEALFEMTYLDAIIYETLRKYPALPFIDRRCMRNYKIRNSDIVIEAGTPVLIPMFGVHYDPELYPNPQVFDPDRFCEANVHKTPSCAFIPFGAGPRSCIGERFGLLKTKLGLAEILAKYEVIRTEKTPVPIVFDNKSLTLSALGGLPLKLVKIENSDRKLNGQLTVIGRN